MRREKPVSGEFYRHFKGKLYQVLLTAKDSESTKETVVYQGLYPPYEKWVRPLDDFMAETDREKYPEASQKYRFEKVLEEGMSGFSDSGERQGADEVSFPGQRVGDEELKKALRTGQPERYLINRIADSEVAERGFLMLLDAETFREKRQIYIGLRSYLDKRLLSNIAVALDIVLEDGSIEEQYESILACLDKLDHYEGGRLR